MERSLVERARAGDADAFDQLVRGRIDAVYRVALAILGNGADARDATQDAFVSAWRNLPRLRDLERFDAWLHRITVNAAKMVLRRRRGVREIRLIDAAEPPAGSDFRDAWRSRSDKTGGESDDVEDGEAFGRWHDVARRQR